MVGPPTIHRCISCGCVIADDGPEQTEAWLASLCPECHEASVHSLRDWDGERAFACCGHAQHLRRRVDGVVHAECVDCGIKWREFSMAPEMALGST